MSKNVYLFYFAAKLQLFADTNKKMSKIHIDNCLLLNLLIYHILLEPVYIQGL